MSSILCFVWGILLGIFFFGGLWLTVRHLPATEHPVALSLGGFVLRMALTIAGFVLVINGRWQNAVATLLGFTGARLFLRFNMRSKACI